ncbi:hypothetical protein ColTof4_07271 [Colletotrichum tofieldiae]|nr:hypothetical protein ColTof3_12212 [Colletotrichum tofieldiae]GKT74848.1 hypothetical protein ColTof4_07271 [Colletotrichum tofieldiae]
MTPGHGHHYMVSGFLAPACLLYALRSLAVQAKTSKVVWSRETERQRRRKERHARADIFPVHRHTYHASIPHSNTSSTHPLAQHSTAQHSTAQLNPTTAPLGSAGGGFVQQAPVVLHTPTRTNHRPRARLPPCPGHHALALAGV